MTSDCISMLATCRASGVLACVAWWFLSNFGALGKRENHDKKRQSREEPGIQTFEKPLCVFAFKLLKPPSYASYTLGNGGFFLS